LIIRCREGKRESGENDIDNAEEAQHAYDDWDLKRSKGDNRCN